MKLVSVYVYRFSDFNISFCNEVDRWLRSVPGKSASDEFDMEEFETRVDLETATKEVVLVSLQFSE